MLSYTPDLELSVFQSTSSSTLFRADVINKKAFFHDLDLARTGEFTQRWSFFLIVTSLLGVSN